MNRYFPAAQWSASLKAISLLSAVIIGGVSYAAYRAIPTPNGITHNFGLGVAVIPLAVLVGAVFFIVRGYTIEASQLRVERLISSTRVSLSGLKRAWADPAICKGSRRLVGNGGLFSFSGWFYNKRLGRYRLFATAFQNSVVLKFPDRVIVVSPAVPSVFIDHLRRLMPELLVGPEEIAGM